MRRRLKCAFASFGQLRPHKARARARTKRVVHAHDALRVARRRIELSLFVRCCAARTTALRTTRNAKPALRPLEGADSSLARLLRLLIRKRPQRAPHANRLRAACELGTDATKREPNTNLGAGRAVFGLDQISSAAEGNNLVVNRTGSGRFARFARWARARARARASLMIDKGHCLAALRCVALRSGGCGGAGARSSNDDDDDNGPKGKGETQPQRARCKGAPQS